MKGKWILSAKLLSAALTFLLVLTALTSCQKPDDPGETAEGQGRESVSESIEAQSREEGSLTDPGGIRPGTGEGSKEPETGEVSEGKTEASSQTETTRDPAEDVVLPESWLNGVPASTLYRKLAVSDFDRVDIGEDLVRWIANENTFGNGEETSYCRSGATMDMVYRRMDGSGIVLRFHRFNSQSAKLILIHQMDQADRDSGVKSVRPGLKLQLDISMDFFSFQKLLITPQLRKVFRSGEEEDLYRLCSEFCEAHNEALSDLGLDWSGLLFQQRPDEGLSFPGPEEETEPMTDPEKETEPMTDPEEDPAPVPGAIFSFSVEGGYITLDRKGFIWFLDDSDPEDTDLKPVLFEMSEFSYLYLCVWEDGTAHPIYEDSGWLMHQMSEALAALPPEDPYSDTWDLIFDPDTGFYYL